MKFNLMNEAGEVTWQHQTRVVLGEEATEARKMKRYHSTARRL